MILHRLVDPSAGPQEALHLGASPGFCRSGRRRCFPQRHWGGTQKPSRLGR